MDRRAVSQGASSVGHDRDASGRLDAIHESLQDLQLVDAEAAVSVTASGMPPRSETRWRFLFPVCLEVRRVLANFLNPLIGGHARRVQARLPRVFSPQMHRWIDLVALTGVITSVVWMSRRDSRTAALLATDYPPGFLRWMSFRDHIWTATLHGILAASLALLVPGILPRNRRILLALASMPIVLSALSDTREQ